MKSKSFLSLLLLGLTASAPVSKPLVSTVTGDYIEARTASVFCGACHYNGELVTEGRDAILAWNITAGSWNGVDLTGVRAIAEVSSDQNLLSTDTPRKCEIAIDISATDAQANAMVDLITKTGGNNLGPISATRRTSIRFDHAGSEYKVAAEGFADLTAQSLPNDECCTQPHLVWYSPLMPIEHRKVGYTQSANYTAGTNGDTWQREDENSAFYGTLSIPSR